MEKDKVRFKRHLVSLQEYHIDNSWYQISGGDMGTTDMERLINLEEDWSVDDCNDFDEYEDWDE